MSEVFVAERGQLTPASKRDLRAAGVAVVEVKNLSRCQFVRASTVLAGDDLLWASLDALNLHGGYGSLGDKQREQFVANLAAIVTRKAGPDA